MQCSLWTAFVFSFLSLIYGSAFAAVSQGMLYFNSCLMIAYRMTFAAVVVLLILAFRIVFLPGYWHIVKAHFSGGVSKIFWMACSGLLFHGFPHSIIAISQNWISSATVQLAQPLAPCVGAILGHFLLEDEHFTWLKFGSLILAVSGVALSAVPAFVNIADSDTSSSNLILGYVLLIIGCCSFGFAPVVMKWKTPNVDITVSACVQVVSSAIIVFVFSLCYDSPKVISQQSADAPPIAWLWPLLVGLLATGIASHGFIILVNNMGAFGANFITIGQILVGVIVGVAALGEWDKYTVWQIIISIIGILLLIGSILIGLYSPKADVPAYDEKDGGSGELSDNELHDLENKHNEESISEL